MSESLSDPFTIEQAIARADLPANIRTQDVATLSEQYWNNFSPATMSEVTSRTQPVLFHAQRVGFRLELPAKPCGGEYKLVLKFKDWAYAETEPSLPTKTFTSADFIKLDKKEITPWPSATTYKTYEEFGLPLTQGRRARLVSAELVSAGTCADLPAGYGTFGLNSVDFALSLGRVDADHAYGILSLNAPSITSDLFTPAALQLTAHPSVTVLRDVNNAPRQISAPSVFVDILTLNPTSYVVSSYLPSQVGTPAPITGLRPFTGLPFKSYTFTGNTSGAPSLTLTPSDVPDSAATYSWDASTGTMTMAQSASDRVESIASTTTGTSTPVTTEVRAIKNNAGTLVTQSTSVYTTYAFGRVPTSQRIGSGVNAQTTTTDYHTNSSDTASYGRVSKITEPSGAWTSYTYDTKGRVLTETRRYLNVSSTVSSSNILTTTTYGTLPDQDGDTLPETLITRVEQTLGVETSRSYELTFTATETYNTLPTHRTHSIQATAPGAAWDAATNLVSVSRTVASGTYLDKPAANLSADGSLTTYTYVTAPTTGELTTSSDSGTANTARTAVTAGTRSVTVTDSFGRTVSQSTTDIATSTLLEAYVVTTRDTAGRATRTDYADGTFTLSSYACCGLDSSTDRQGVTTTFVYDPLGRLERTTSQGKTTRYTYAAAGRRLKTIRIGTDNTEITLEDTTYDDAGRPTLSKDALGRATSYSYLYPAGGGLTQTITNPAGGTTIQTSAADVQLLQIDGTATPWRTYAYTVNADGSRTTTEYAPAATITDTTAYRKTTTDFLGRTTSEVAADGATTNRFYNTLGQLVRQTDPDGVQTLFAYDAQGQLTTTALDLNRNGVIDYAGTDRITRTTPTYATRLVGSVTTPVRRTTTELWEADNANTPTTITTEATLDGRSTWQTTRGLTTSSVTTYAANGDPTTVTTTPDGTLQTSVTLNGRPQSTVISNPTLGTLSTTTYDYDAHGRLWHQVSPAGTTTYTYFADDQPQTVTTPDPDTTLSGIGYDPQTTTYRYDSAGRVDRVTLPDGTETFTTYTPTAQVLSTWGSRTYAQAYTYDAQQRVKTLTTWQDYAAQTGSATTTWNYDPQTGRLLNKRDAAGLGATYTYWPSGRLKTRTWARTGAPLTTYTYSLGGDLQLIDYSDSTPDVTQTYDRLGRLKTTTDAAGLLSRTYQNGALDDETYSTGILDGQSLLRTQDSLQRLSSLTATGMTKVTYSYDAVSRLKSLTQGTRVASQTYHATRGYPLAVTIKNSSTTRSTATRTLDALGRLTSIVNTPTAVKTSATYTYNSANQRTRATTADNTYWSYGYDALGQVISSVKRESTATVRPGHTYGYDYDDIGNRQQVTLNNLTTLYASSPTNQYLSRTTPAAIPVLGMAASTTTVKINDQPAAARAGSWFYHELALDGSGAPAYLQFPVSATTLQGTPPTSELVRSEVQQVYVPPSPEIYAYDLDGNLTQDGRWDYAYDAENRLISVQTRADMAAAAPGLPRQRLTFSYDFQGRRIAKKVENYSVVTSTWSTTTDLRFLYDGWNLLAEKDALAANALLRGYSWGLDLSGSTQGAGGVGGLVWASVGTASYSPAYDGNGNIIAWIDLTTGTKVADNDYDPFGKSISISGTNPVPFGFSTKYLDSETSLNYYGFRYYNPNTGRFINKDPLEESGGVSLYGFTANSPTNFVDLLGLALYAFDGTNNDADRDTWANIAAGKTGNGPTNVKILFDAYDGVRFYMHGVGTRESSKAKNVAGLAGGYGGKSRIDDMLASVEAAVAAGDSYADIIGFSRGAATARDFANQLAKKYPCVKIRWIGIFDTVPSFGFGGNDVDVGYEFGVPDSAGRVLHLTAADEHRFFFPLASINQGQGLGPANPNWSEEVMPGAHSDIGGGYTYDNPGGKYGGNARGYANAALQRMQSDGIAHGVPFKPIASEYLDTNQTKPHDSRWAVDFARGTRKTVRPKRTTLSIDYNYFAPRNVFYHP
jgi:RHS repeat-associated protein